MASELRAANCLARALFRLQTERRPPEADTMAATDTSRASNCVRVCGHRLCLCLRLCVRVRLRLHLRLCARWRVYLWPMCASVAAADNKTTTTTTTTKAHASAAHFPIRSPANGSVRVCLIAATRKRSARASCCGRRNFCRIKLCRCVAAADQICGDHQNRKWTLGSGSRAAAAAERFANGAAAAAAAAKVY